MNAIDLPAADAVNHGNVADGASIPRKGLSLLCQRHKPDQLRQRDDLGQFAITIFTALGLVGIKASRNHHGACAQFDRLRFIFQADLLLPNLGAFAAAGTVFPIDRWC